MNVHGSESDFLNEQMTRHGEHKEEEGDGSISFQENETLQQSAVVRPVDEFANIFMHEDVQYMACSKGNNGCIDNIQNISSALSGDGVACSNTRLPVTQNVLPDYSKPIHTLPFVPPYAVKPKRPLSGYNLFYKVERDRIVLAPNPERKGKRAKTAKKPYTVDEVHNAALLIMSGKSRSVNPNDNTTSTKFGIGDLTKVVGERWQNLSVRDRALFEEYAQKERERYNDQLKQYEMYQQNLNAQESSQAPLPPAYQNIPIPTCTEEEIEPLNQPSFYQMLLMEQERRVAAKRFALTEPNNMRVDNNEGSNGTDTVPTTKKKVSGMINKPLPTRKASISTSSSGTRGTNTQGCDGGTSDRHTDKKKALTQQERQELIALIEANMKQNQLEIPHGAHMSGRV